MAQDWIDAFDEHLDLTNLPAINIEITKKTHTIRSVFLQVENYWLNDRRNRRGDKIDPNTAKAWAAKIKRYVLTDNIADIPLDYELFTPVQVVRWLDNVKRLGLAKYTIKDTVLALRTLIGDARRRGWIDLPHNPVADEMVRYEVPIGETRAGANNPIHLSKEQAIALITCTSEAIPFARKVKNLLALTSGMRSGEINGLCWRQINLDIRTIEITRQLVSGGPTPRFKAPKAGSERTIPLHPLAVAALAALKAKVNPKPDDAVFPDAKTGYYCRGNDARTFRDDLAIAGVATQYQGKYNIDYHSTRRTVMTMLSDAGISGDDISVIAGHGIKGVRRHYVAAHIIRYWEIINALPYNNIELKWLV